MEGIDLTEEIKEEVKEEETKVESKAPEVSIVPNIKFGEGIVAMLVCIRGPNMNEGKFTMCELELHSKSGGRGRLYFPYLSDFGSLGTTWSVDLVLRPTDQKNYLKNRIDTFDLVREDDGTPIVGVV